MTGVLMGMLVSGFPSDAEIRNHKLTVCCGVLYRIPINKSDPEFKLGNYYQYYITGRFR